MRGNITIDSTDIKRMICQHIWPLKQKFKFLERCKLTKLIQEEIDNLNVSVSIKGSEFLVKQTNKKYPPNLKPSYRENFRSRGFHRQSNTT